MFRLSFYVPEDHLEQVKQMLFNAGAGKIGGYDQCCWQSKGVGQFRPLADSQPFFGKVNTIEVLDEWKVELVCEEQYINDVVQALKTAHPYEQVAYNVVRLHSI